jgi:hypothetical protein
MSASVAVAFRPSEHGWHFPNQWTKGAPASISGITVGRVYGGLCGGMCVSAAKAWHAGKPLPQTREVPSDGPITAMLWEAQLQSMDLPQGPLRYLRLQLPMAAATRRRSTLGAAIPAVRRTLQAGRAAPLGLVRALSWNPAAVGQHHVVLVYRLAVGQPDPALPPTEVVLSAYDPNHPDDNRVRLRVGPDGAIEHTRSSKPVYALVPLT